MSVLVQESEKATRYIGLLNEARLHGSWNDVPELVRKVDKHAPHRKCLTLTATAEAHTASSATRRPGTASSALSHTSLLDVTPNLVQAIDQEQTHFEDAFQANVALHEIYFLRAEWSAVVGGLDHDVWHQVAPYTKSPSDMAPTTRLAIVKSRYFLGVAKEQTASLDQALKAYNQALPAIEQAPIGLASSHEYRIWAARLSGRICTLHSNQDNQSTLSGASSALISFRAWARITNHDPSRSSLSPPYGRGSHDVSNRDVWSLYYHFLSFILASDLIYTESAHAPLALYSPDIPSLDLARVRLRQRNELKQVEAAYESLLLSATRFPQASQSNQDIEQWTQQVVSNWSVLCGPKWREIDLGEGGKAAVGRNVLDILYRAATKSFHSTPVLRHLFTVHASLADFDLAISAFDSYSEIVGRAKSRAEKTGHGEVELDSDDLVVLTAAQAIGILCRYGSEPEGAKAVDIAKKLSGWIQQKQRPTSTSTFATVEGNTHSHSDDSATGALVSISSLIAAHRAIGESQANWARLSHDSAQRSEYRTRAIKSLRKASEMSRGASDPETALLLATVLAENRELQLAVQVVKQALAASAQDKDEDSEADAVSQRRLLMPLWHLMSLLLTARGEHENAVKFCDAAFDQFGGVDILFGDSEGDMQPTALIGTMEDSEKEGLLQLRLTQIALTELVDGPEVSVDSSIELVALYNKLFGVKNLGTSLMQNESAPVIPSAAPTLAPPTKQVSALKSISGSIMGKSRTARMNTNNTAQETGVPGTQTANGAPITIQVTNQDAVASEKHHKIHIPHHPLKHLGHHGHASDPEKEAISQEQHPPVPSRDGVPNTGGQDFATSQPLPTMAHNITHSKQPAPVGHPNQLPSQDLRLPAPHPAVAAAPRPRYPSAQQKRHTVSLLVEVWLYIAGQYTRVEMFEDTEGAIDEAHKLVDAFQQAIAKEESSARAFDERGWGGGKSINRLWADVWSERADLSVARSEPHEALAAYERALAHYPDHPAAIVGISSILLDIYEEKTLIEAPSDSIIPTNAAATADKTTPSPATLTRLAARDRAYMLLSTLTKSGEGWDDSEAWSMLARAHELSGQVDRARECLWFLVELEDGRPVRPWHVVASAL